MVSHHRILLGACLCLARAPEVRALSLRANPVDNDGVLVASHSSADVKEALEAPKPYTVNNTERPRLLLMNGCSASSFVVHLGGIFLQLHGSKFQNFGDAETMNPTKNPFFLKAGGSLGDAITMAAKDAVKDNLTYVIKGMLKDNPEFVQNWNQAAPALKSLGVYAIHGIRRNHLNKLACMIKDCFVDEQYGYPVTLDGEQSSLCFDRRAGTVSGGGPWGYKAYINTFSIIEALQSMEAENDFVRQHMKESGFLVHEVSMEELTNYQSDGSNQAFHEAVEGWSKFLRFWGVDPVKDIIIERLSQLRGTRKPENQADSIYNIEEVTTKLKYHPKLEWMVE